MKQTISNACGTIAMLHSIGNNRDKLELGMCGTAVVRKPHLQYQPGTSEHGVAAQGHVHSDASVDPCVRDLAFI